MARLKIHERDVGRSIHLGEVKPGTAVRGMLLEFRGIVLADGRVKTSERVLILGPTEPVRIYEMELNERSRIFSGKFRISFADRRN